MENLNAILLGIIASAIFELLKKWILTSITAPKDEKVFVGRKYKTSTLKRQFYICFPIGIFCISTLELFDRYSILFGMIGGFCLFFSYCAFACAIEELNSIENHDSEQK